MMRAHARGFTLVEALVALVILGIIAVLAYRGSAALTGGEAQLAEESAKWRTLDSVFTRPRSGPAAGDTAAVPSRRAHGAAWSVIPEDAAGNSALVFSARRARVRARSGCRGQRIGYRVRDGALEVVFWPQLDNVADTAPRAFPLIGGIAGFHVAALTSSNQVVGALAGRHEGRAAARGTCRADARGRHAHRALVRLAMMRRHRHARMSGAAIIIAMIVAALAATVPSRSPPSSSAGSPAWRRGATRCRRNRSRWPPCSGRARSCSTTVHAAASTYLGEPWACRCPHAARERLDRGPHRRRAGPHQREQPDPGGRTGRQRARAASLVCSRAPGSVNPRSTRSPIGRRRHAGAAAGRAGRVVRASGDAVPRRACADAAHRELAAVRGFDDAALARVMPYLAALARDDGASTSTPPRGRARRAAAGPARRLAGLVAERVTRPFTSIADFRNRLPQGAVVDDERAFAVASSYFLVTVRARQGDTVAQARALLKRSQGAWPVVVWQTIE
jgi:prepilin-type N-terminal cleavage/methylation domain-containing protein